MDFQQLMARMVELDQPVQESDKQASKDYDGDGEVESGKDEYMGSRDKAIKKATGNDDEETKESLDLLADELEQDMDECGMGPMSMPSMNKQQDNVSMNVSMNGAGSGGIRDLMNILRNLEDAGDSHGHDHDDGLDIKLAQPSVLMKKEPVLGDEYANSPDVQLGQGNFPIDQGNDLHKSKNSYSDKPYRGDNPMALEGLQSRLASMYNTIKSRN
jgi:hypothetical protein